MREKYSIRIILTFLIMYVQIVEVIFSDLATYLRHKENNSNKKT